MRSILAFIIIIASAGLFARGLFAPVHDELNLGFELRDTATQPLNWYIGGRGGLPTAREKGYIIELDDKIMHGGRLSLHMKHLFGTNWVTARQDMRIADDIRGKQVRYSGWIRVKGAVNQAGLWLTQKIGDQSVVNSNSIDSSMKHGDTWQRISADFFVDPNMSDVDFGVLLSGGGEVWFDDLQIDTNGVLYAR